ncbi:MAG: DUF3078 domain-containing protein [Saprospiraceae bacterium]|nr:DUF3078 domain-containing protein [Saprospiraceae bacterium]
MLKNLFTLCLLLFAGTVIGQVDADALKSQIAAKEGQIGTLQGEIDALKAQIPPSYGWVYDAAGVLGLNFSSFNKWLGAENSNTFATNIGFAGSGSANLLEEKFFWRNGANLTMGWTKLDTDTEDLVDPDLEKTADAINATSLYGYKLNDKWAASALGEYRSTLLSNFNNPGFLDVGVGVTWTPISDLVVVIHPANYNFVFADDDLTYESSLGAKVVADYARALPGGLAWKSKLSAFLSYEDTKNFSNWTWINGFNVNIMNGLGVGFELGLRGNKQEGFNNFLTNNPDTAPEFKIDDLDKDENPVQSYWLLGFTYNL